MSMEKSKITLAGKNLAIEGMEFIYEGESSACEGCKLHKVCHNLRPRRRYRIVNVRTNTLHSCNVHNEGAYTVEVVVAPIQSAVPSERAILHSRITFETNCTETGCPNFSLCNPEGVIEDEGYHIEEVFGDLEKPCVLGKRMVAVLFRPISE